jgi:hypothetical protein
MHVPERCGHEDAWLLDSNTAPRGTEVGILHTSGEKEYTHEVYVRRQPTGDPEDVRWEIRRLRTDELIAVGLCEAYGRTVPDFGNRPGASPSGDKIFAEKAEDGVATFG